MRVFKALQAAVNLTNVQGDLFSRGFPKHYEIYYFFSIKTNKSFPKALGNLMSKKYISDLEKIASDLKGVQDLELKKLIKSDPTFSFGMKKENMRKILRDPPTEDWDSLFREEIDGIIKVAGSDQEQAETKLQAIKKALGHGAATDAPIEDIKKLSSPTAQESRVDGKVRSKEKNLNGLEYFGFQDGISQPLVVGIDKPKTLEANPFMVTDPGIIIVTKSSPASLNEVGISGDPSQRPGWMADGSFLVFRKLEQSVGKFNDLTKLVKGKTDLEVGARLMGRWQNGNSLMSSQNPPRKPKPELDDLIADNNFKYGIGNADENRDNTRSACPLAAHVRKTNPRFVNPSSGLPETQHRIIRNGIPYGSEFDKTNTAADADSGRGLLFACYQSSIDRGFFFIQNQWANKPEFGSSRTDLEPGFDPIIGQAKGGKLEFDKNNESSDKLGPFTQLVTMKGGEYFFVPSLSALSGILGTTSTSSRT